MCPVNDHLDKIVIVDNHMISMWIYPKRKMIHHVMKAHCHGIRFREALLKGTEALIECKATKWLSDDRSNGALLVEDSSWAQAEWFPRTKAAGWKHWGVVQPAKIIGQMNMSRFIRELTDQGINARMFGNPDEALRWLETRE
jgi:hypothetical protein